MTDRPPWEPAEPDDTEDPRFSVPPLQPEDVDRPLPDVPPPLEEVDVAWVASGAPRAATPFSVWLARGWDLTTKDVAGAIVAGLPLTVAAVVALVLGAALAYPLVWGQSLRGTGVVVQALALAAMLLVALPAAAARAAAALIVRVGAEAQTPRAPRPSALACLSAMGVLLPFWLCGLLGVAAATRIGVLGVPVCFAFAVPLSAWAALGLYEVVGEGSDVAGALVMAWRLLARSPANVCGLGAATVAIAAASVAMCCVAVPVAVPVLLAAWAAAHEDLSGRAQRG